MKCSLRLPNDMQLVLLSLFLSGIFLAVDSTCSGSGNDVQEGIQCTFLNVASAQNSASSVAIVGASQHSCPRLIDGDIKDNSEDGDQNPNSHVKITFARPYIVDTLRIAESEDTAESKEIKLVFSDSTSHTITLQFGLYDPEEFSFMPRVVSWVELKELSKFTEGSARFTEVEFYYSECHNEKICDYFDLSNAPESPRYLLGEVLYFMRDTTTDMDLKLFSATQTFIYKLSFSTTVSLYNDTVIQVSKAAIPGASGNSHWIPFWVDLRDPTHIVVGTGATVLITEDTAGEDPVHFGKFVRTSGPPGGKLVFCDRKASCYEDAAYYWPLDKVISNKVFNSIDKSSSKAYGAVSTNIEGPTLAAGQRTSVLLSHGSVALDFSSSCIYNLESCTNGMSISLWLKIESLPQTTSYYANGGSTNVGFSIYSPSVADRMDPNNIVEIEFQNLVYSWRSSAFFSLKTWHHIACSWHPSGGLLCLLDLTTVLEVTERAPTSSFGSFVLGKSTVVPNSFSNASYSSFAVWDRKLTTSEFQRLYYCMGLKPRSQTHNALGIKNYKLSDDSFSASSHAERGEPQSVRESLNGWTSEVSDTKQYLQIDFFALTEIHSLEMRGNSSLNHYVKTFTLSQSKDTRTWATYKDAGGNEKVFTGNTDSLNAKTIDLNPAVVTRYLRIHPVSYNDGISLKLEMFGNQTDANYVACLPAATSIKREDLAVSASTPYDCSIMCGQRGKPFALLVAGGDCYCPNSVTTSAAVLNDFCRLPCYKRKTLTCGGENHAAAFTALESSNRTFHVSAPLWVKESAAFNLTLSSSDNAMFDLYTGNEVASTEKPYFLLSFPETGARSFVVEATMGQYAPQSLQRKRSVFVAEKTKGVTLTCPRLVLASKSYDCVFEGVTGTTDIFNYSMNGVLLDSLTLGRSFLGTVGGVHNPVTKPDDTQSGVLFISSFPESAVLSHVQLHAQQGGYLTVLIFRPVCGSGPFREYCDIAGDCTFFHPVCDEVSGYECSGDTVFHLSSAKCLASNSLTCVGAAKMPGFIPQQYQKYEVIYESRVVVASGMNSYPLTVQESPRVRENDVIGVSYPATNPARLSVESVDGYEAVLNLANSAEIARGDYIEASNNVKTTHVRHSLKALYYVPQSTLLPITLPKGVHHVAIDLRNSVNEVHLSETIVSVAALEDARWTLDDIVPTHALFSITAQANAGVNITYVVQYDDGTVEQKFEEDNSAVSFTHTFTSPGYKFLELRAWNYLSEEVTRYMVLVQDLINDVNLTIQVKPTKLTQNTTIDWYIDSGSRVTIEIDLGDNTTSRIDPEDVHGKKSRSIKHVYADPLEFWINITAYNLVNRVELYFMIIVEVPIDNLRSQVIHANRDIEVNETVVIDLTQRAGTNVIHHFQFQDGSTLLTRDTNITKNYTYWAVFPVNITAWNNVSWVTWTQKIKVHKPVRNLTGFVITTSPTNHTDPVQFDFDMTTGSDFNCTWDFDDSNYGKSSYWITDDQVYKWPITHQVISHMYAGIGVYVVRITCTNRLYETTAWTISIVQVPISRFEVDQPPVQRNDKNLTVDFRARNGTNITYNVTFYHVWERTPIAIHNVTISQDTLVGLAMIAKEYFTDRVGLYDVKITAVNLVTPVQVITRTVIVDRPIRNFVITIHADYVETNRTVNYTIQADASNVTITWDFDDPYAGSSNLKTRSFQGVFPADGWTVWHMFNHSGFYTLKVNLSNSLGNNQTKKKVIGQYGVYLHTVTDSPRPLPPGRMNFTFIPLPEKYHPTDANMTMAFGDGRSYSGTYNSTVIHNYTGWGMFTVNCTIWNEISWGFLTVDVEIQRMIEGLVLTPFHSAGDAGYFGAARGLNKDRLPLEYDVIWNVTSTDGTNITYTYEFGDGESEVTRNTTVFHKYPSVKNYTATVVAENAVSRASASFKIRIQKIVIGVDVDSDCPRKLGDKTTFTVSIDQIGTESCYLLKFGNNSDNYLFKDAESTDCEQLFYDLTKPADRQVFRTNPFNVTYTYGYIDVYWPRLIGSNLVSKTWNFHKAVVVHDHCRYPKVDIFNIGRNTTLAPKILRSQLFFVDTENVIKCDASKTTKFFWEVFIVNPNPGQNDTLYNLPPSVAVTNPRFRIDQRTLPYELYRFRFTITMQGIRGVLGHDDAFLEIVESPMVAMVAGGTGLAKGVNQNLTLDASGTEDPDVGPKEYQNMTVTWDCKALDRNGATTDQAVLGCSGENFTRLASGNAADMVYLPTDFAKLPSALYTLKLSVRKNNRHASTYFNLYTERDNMLRVFVKCLQNCKKKRITAQKMAYEGGIQGVDDQETKKRMTYSWKLFRAKEPGRSKRVKEHRWQEKEDFAEMALTPTDADTVVISEKMLWPEYRYRLRVHIELDGKKGYAEDELFVNQPPGEGHCFVDPPEGYAFSTQFRIKCLDWADEDMPLSYKFAYKTSDEEFESLVYFGSKSQTPPIQLPVGKPELNYSITIIVDTQDEFKASNVTKHYVKVTCKQVTDVLEFERSTMRMISENGPLGNMIASGNIHGAMQLVGGVSSCLNELAQVSCNFTDETEQALDVDNMSPEERQKLERQRQVKQLEKKLECDRQREQRIEMRRHMLNIVSSIFCDSVDQLRETATAISLITNTPDEITDEMQETAVKAAQNLVGFLGNSTSSGESANPNENLQAVGGVALMAGNYFASVNGSGYNDTDKEADGNGTTKTLDPNKEKVTNAFAVVANLGSTLLGQKFAGEPPTEVKTPHLSIAVQRANPSSLGSSASSTGGGSFALPAAGSLLGIQGNDTNGLPPVDAMTQSHNNNPFVWDSTASQVKSKVMTMELKNASGHPIKIANLSKPIDIWVPRSVSVNFTLYTIDYNQMLYRAFTVVQNDTSIQVEIIPEDNNTELIAYLRYGAFPRDDLYDFKFLVPKREFVVESVNGSTSNKTNERQINPFILFRSNVDMNKTAAGKYYIGVKYNGTFETVYETVVSGSELLRKEYIPLSANFTMRTFTSSCLYWDTDNDTWSTEGCIVGPKTAMEGTQCLCTHLTSFGGDMVVAPNVIDWSAISLDNLLANPVVFAVVASFIALYFILLIPARRQDKKDLEKLGVVPLPDNDPRDNYSYEITVYTGFSAEAGTTANIYFILKGTLDETPVRVLKDPNKNKFSVGSINYFLLTVPSSLGKLKSLRIWHDNGGTSPSWYLLRLMVHDLQRDTKTWFLCDRWLAVEEDDGQIERNLRLANSEDLTKFNLLFQTEARRNLSDGHIWFSVVKRPVRSNFTRVQRLSCCLCILLTTMLANAMFYQNDPSSSGDGVLKVGPFSFSLQQLSIAITSSLVVLPVNVFVVWIFRNTRPKKTTKDKQFGRNSNKYSLDSAGPKQNKLQSSKKKDEGRKKKRSLPYWMTYVAYFLIFLACSVSAAFTVFYGLTFGKAKSEAWISAMMISFWQDVLVSQPLKVFAAATLFALITKDPKKATGEDKEDTMPAPELQEDEEFATNQKSAGLMSMARVDPRPPDPESLQASRELKLKQRQMKLIIYDVIWYFIFLTVLLSVAHGNKDNLAYDTTSTMSSMFEDNSYTNWISLAEVTDAKLYWYWSRFSLLPTLIPNQWYGPNEYMENVVWVASDTTISRSRGARSRLLLSKNKQRKLQSRPGAMPNMNLVLNGTINYPENYVADHATDYTVGVARYRQLRVKPNQCSVHPVFRTMFSECNSFYSWEREDEGKYFAGWVPDPLTNVNKTDEESTEKQKNSWFYNTAWQLKGTPYWAGFSTYWGGGFVADLGHNQSLALNMTSYLQENNWLDRYTRAIFIEFTVYNPGTNMFCVMTLLTEIIPTGGYYQFNEIYPMRLYRYFGSNLLAIMILEITLMTFLLYFAYREFKKWRRLGRLYWKDVWTYMELLVLASCFSTIGLYFARMVATDYSIGLMRENPTSFVSFHYVAALDLWLTFTLGMAVFLSFLKTLSLLRFNRRMSFMGKTLTLCWKPLSSFFVVYVVVFLAYAALGFLVFGRVARDYHTFQSSMANILGMTLGAFNFHALVDAHSIIGPIFFFTFTFVVNFILINVFVAIICESLASVTSDATNQSSDHEMLDFMVHEFKKFIGLRVSPAVKPVYREPMEELEGNVDKIQKKSENAETTLRNMCMEEIRNMSWFDAKHCTTKKKLLVRLLLHAEDQLTEYDICDAIPLLEEVLATYTEKDIKEWLGDYNVHIEEPGSTNSSMLFSRTKIYDSDEDGDEVSDDESLRSGRWSQLSEETVVSPSLSSLPHHRFVSDGGPEAPDAMTGSVENYYRTHERPPSTAERFCRPATASSMTSLNYSLADADRMLLEDEHQRWIMDDSEGEEGNAGQREIVQYEMGQREDDSEADSLEGDKEKEDKQNDDLVNEEMERITAWMATRQEASVSPHGNVSPAVSSSASRPETSSCSGTASRSEMSSRSGTISSLGTSSRSGTGSCSGTAGGNSSKSPVVPENTPRHQMLFQQFPSPRVARESELIKVEEFSD